MKKIKVINLKKALDKKNSSNHCNSPQWNTNGVVLRHSLSYACV